MGIISLKIPTKLYPTQDKATLTAKKVDHGKKDVALRKLQEASDTDKEAHAAAQKHYHAVSAGLSSNKDGEDASLNEQLMGKGSSRNYCLERVDGNQFVVV